MSEQQDFAALGAKKREAHVVKERYLEAFLAEELNLAQLLDISRSSGEGRHVGAIRLKTILRRMRGWTPSSAENALLRTGFRSVDTIKTIRGSRSKSRRFQNLLDSTPSRWQTRPAAPEGWPWEGKLSLLIEDCGAAVPRELGGTGIAPAPKVSEDELDELLGGDLD